MKFTPALLPHLIDAIADVIEKNAEEVTALDQAIGDGDHVTNLQRGIQALIPQREEMSQLDWAAAWQKKQYVFFFFFVAGTGLRSCCQVDLSLELDEPTHPQLAG